MACRPLWIHANDDRVEIAICRDAYDLLSIAGSFSLMPEALTASAEKNRFSQIPRFDKALAAHVCNGKHFSGRRVPDQDLIAVLEPV